MKNQYSVIYAPRGAAAEYAELAVNLYHGCRNGCKYCYAPDCLRTDKTKFHGNYSPRQDILAKIEHDLNDMRALGDKRPVTMCFTCDPYPVAGWRSGDDSIMTRGAIRLFSEFDHRFTILTKSGMAGCQDFELYKHGDKFGATLTCLDTGMSLAWEPLAADPATRISGLEIAAEKGIYTWVSFEPVIDTEQTYRLYEATKGFVTEYKIGKMNHINRISCSEAEKQRLNSIDWKRFAETMIEKCERDGKKYYIKDALREYLEK